MSSTINTGAPSGSAFREARQAAGVSQNAAAVACGIDRSTLQGYENGRTTPQPLTLAALARFYRRCVRQTRDTGATAKGAA